MAWASTLGRGRHDHRLAGHQPDRPDAQAGDHGRLQRRRASTWATSRWRPSRSPATTSATLGSRGGVTVRLAADDPQSVVIRFFDAEGLDIDEAAQRKIERLYHREEFRRVLAREIGDIDFPARAVEQYTADLVAAVDLSTTRSRRAQAGARPLLRVGQLRHAQRAGQARRRRAGGEPLRADRRDDRGRPVANAERVAELVRASGAHLGAVVDADGEHLTIVDDEGTVLSDDQALLVLLRLVSRDRARTPGWRCRWRCPRGGRAICARGRGHASPTPSCRRPT